MSLNTAASKVSGRNTKADVGKSKCVLLSRILKVPKLKVPKTRNPKARKGWHLVQHDIGKGMSAPDYFINYPYEFLNEFYCLGAIFPDGEFYISDVISSYYDWRLLEEVEHIMKLITRIRLPRRYQGKASAIQIFDPLKPFVFEITADKDRLRQLLINSTGHIDKSPSIDLLAPYLMGVSPRALKRTVDYVLSEIDEKHPGAWNSNKCDRFFSMAANFDDRRDC